MFKSFCRAVYINNLILQCPVDGDYFQEFAITVSYNGVVSIWNEFYVEEGIKFIPGVGFYCWDNHPDEPIDIGVIDVEHPDFEILYKNCIWLFEKDVHNNILLKTLEKFE